ncbi:bifunctional endoribonuclease/protein kinase ire1 [Kappamyces sp. JEL0829]|nr:bifunctional endoribonuclease/protein kinase ire1 [Kappamyces sp. JEL0829]
MLKGGPMVQVVDSSASISPSTVLGSNQVLPPPEGAYEVGHASTKALTDHVANTGSNIIFIPEPTGNGDLYFVEPGNDIKKFETPLKKIIDNNMGVKDGSRIYTGSKTTQVLAVDPMTGEILKVFGDQTEEPKECQESTKDAVFIGRTQYRLDIYDSQSDKLMWNISYVEYLPASGAYVAGPVPASPSVTADVHGNFKINQDSHALLFQTFNAPVLSVFDIISDDAGNHLHLPDRPPKDSDKNSVYVGNHDGTFYLLSDRHFPYMQMDSNHPHETEECTVGSKNYPDCLVGSYTLDVSASEPLLLEEIVEQSGRFWTRTAAVVLVCIVFMFGVVWRHSTQFQAFVRRLQEAVLGKREEREELLAAPPTEVKFRLGDGADDLLQKLIEKKDPAKFKSVGFEDESSTLSRSSSTSLPSTSNTGLKSLEVSDKILGYGSHGTVVLEGSFEGRRVAIKRMLVDFYDVADHEVKMLQESDVHPNVVRYYFKEHCDGFMYIALECCAGSIQDLISRKDIPELHAVRSSLSQKLMFRQIISGIAHLHALNIVHRDIKPQNILISHTKKLQLPRMLISDFGLGKRLADGQSSFHNTFVPGGGVAGTVGWRAPECLLAHHAATASSTETSSDGWNDHMGKRVDISQKSLQTRITKAIDIFSAGCVLYYIASEGQHPFGERFSREMNILKGNFRLQHFDGNDKESLLKDLIRRMISKDPAKRPSAEAILRHPYFWTQSQQLNFLQDISDRLETEPRDPQSPLLKLLERQSNKIIGRDWLSKVNRSVLDSMSKYRKYDGSSVQDLLRALRNKKHHYQDLPEQAKKELGSLPDGFLRYFTSRFPNLLVSMVAFVESHAELVNDPLFAQYFESHEKF